MRMNKFELAEFEIEALFSGEERTKKRAFPEHFDVRRLNHFDGKRFIQQLI